MLARSAFHHSINYRSVVLYGTRARSAAPGERSRRSRRSPRSSCPAAGPTCAGRRARSSRPPRCSRCRSRRARRRSARGPPVDDDEDYALDVWAGRRAAHRLRRAGPIRCCRTSAPQHVTLGSSSAANGHRHRRPRRGRQVHRRPRRRARLGFTYLDTGAMYRASALAAQRDRRAARPRSRERIDIEVGDRVLLDGARRHRPRSATPDGLGGRLAGRGRPRACATRWSRKQQAIMADRRLGRRGPRHRHRRRARRRREGLPAPPTPRSAPAAAPPSAAATSHEVLRASSASATGATPPATARVARAGARRRPDRHHRPHAGRGRRPDRHARRARREELGA